jgi:hypothetical protein
MTFQPASRDAHDFPRRARRRFASAFVALVAACGGFAAEAEIPSAVVALAQPRLNSPDAFKPAYRSSARQEAMPSSSLDSPATAPAILPQAVGPSFEGANNDAGGEGDPPDTHGAVGFDHYVEIVNNRVNVYALYADGRASATPTLAKSADHRAFFGAPATQPSDFYDGRALFDAGENRWIMVAVDARDAQRASFALAVSKTSDPAGRYYIYRYSVPPAAVNGANGWDFPQLGMNRDALFVTGELYRGEDYRATVLIAIPKARAYRGKSLQAKRFSELEGVLSPPTVLDDGQEAFFLSASDGANLHLYKGQNLGDAAHAKMTLAAKIDVPDYRPPDPAAQPGSRLRLDASDARFVNAGVQYGDSLWNIHAIDRDGHAAAKFYEIDAAAAALKQSGFFKASETSDDFNASLAVNPDGEVFVTWTSVDAIQGIAPQMRYSGFAGEFDGDPAVVQGQALFASDAAYAPDRANPQRWGDYSAVSLDPRSYALAGGVCDAWRRAWIVNEVVDDRFSWGSRIAQIGFC